MFGKIIHGRIAGKKFWKLSNFSFTLASCFKLLPMKSQQLLFNNKILRAGASLLLIGTNLETSLAAGLYFFKK